MKSCLDSRTSGVNFKPGIWCECDYCTYAREKGGRNIRFNSSIHFADTCLIDFPADIPKKALEFGIDLLPLDLLLCTHSHEDHFNPQMLYWRYKFYGVENIPGEEKFDAPCARFTELPLLSIYGNRKIFKKMEHIFHNREVADYALDFTIPEVYREYHHGGIDFIPMIATHPDSEGERGLIYLVNAGGKSFLYATDSDRYIDRTRDCIKNHKVDAVIMEATFGTRKMEGHMNLDRVRDELDFFTGHNIFKGEPRVILTHMSPHRCPPYDKLRDMLKGSPIESAYDGMVVEL